MRKTINIATSCSNSLAKYIPPQLAAIAINLHEFHINFYLLHRNISEANIENIKLFSKKYENITLSVICVTDNILFDDLAKYGGRWPAEAYYWLMLHDLLPSSVERILYIDAADVIIQHDISEFYYEDFKGMSIIATAEQVYAKGEEKFFFSDRYCLGQEENRHKLLKRGVMNTGVIVINLTKLRAEGFGEKQIRRKQKEILVYEKKNEGQSHYFGDQGLGSYIFLGDILFFCPIDEDKEWYTPYNFGLWFFMSNTELWYEPAILHFTGIHYKPWEAYFTIEEIQSNARLVENQFLYPFHYNLDQLKYHDIWWRYCKMIPQYSQIKQRAERVAQGMIQVYEKKYGITWAKERGVQNV